MGESFFSFSITRKYPYKWFTPVVIIGGIVFAVLFSLLNFAASGYSLVGINTDNPNTTIANQSWFTRWPTFVSGSTQPTCQPYVLPVNTVFQTNNTAFTYTLTQIYQESDPGIVKIQGSLPYYNNYLEACNVTSIRALLQTISASSSQNYVQFWNIDLSADATCMINIGQGITYLNITASYNLVPPSGQLNLFAGRNATDKPALWWAESILSAYWIQTTANFFRDNLNREFQDNITAPWQWPVYKGSFSFTPQLDDLHRDITSLNYYQPPRCNFEVFNPNGTDSGGPWCDGNLTLEFLSSNPTTFGISAWIPADSLTKSMQSTMLTDLGQNRARQANILNDATALEYFTRNISGIVFDRNINGSTNTAGHLDLPQGHLKQDINLAQVGYNKSNASLPVVVQPSVIATTYSCQIPTRKSTGSLVVSLILADLVFLQGTWKLFLLLVDIYTAKKHPELMRCENCGIDFQRRQYIQKAYTV
ncbi:hypothetical protein F4819DRAFT_506623 [Hypoxylon fuscum]|nr:hypothetical protein F4819DRAFT_506623 [Hypoxylon fuscum]